MAVNVAAAQQEKDALMNHAYTAGILAAVQFRELEDLQTEHSTFIEEVVSTFSDEARVMLAVLRARLTPAPGLGPTDGGGQVALTSGDVAAARAVLHKLKGSALTLGASAVGACCEAVRQHCIAGNYAAVHAPGGIGSLAALELATQQVLELLNRYTVLHAAIVNASHG